MKQLMAFLGRNARSLSWLALAFLVICWLLINRLGSLTGGLSAGELQAATAPVGWHGIFHQPLDLPLKLVRSVVFYLSPDHGRTLTRLPDTLFGGLAMISFGWLIWLWHGRRTAILTTLLFATSAWTLHVSRLASFDVLYLWAMPTLLLCHVLLHRYGDRSIVRTTVVATLGLLLTIPGFVWLVAAELFMQRKEFRQRWQQCGSFLRRLRTFLLFVLWLPLLIIDFTRSGQFVQWLGLPAHWGSLLHLAKQFVAVFVHLFIRGPQYPQLWLGRAPVLDAFALAMCLLGIYFYAQHWKSSRSRLLGLLFGLSTVLIAIGGPVSFSLVVPLAYMVAATGIAYLVHDWLKVFPLNPFARGLGIVIVSLAVAVSCLYNLRSYFVAWPNNAATQATFRYHR